MASLAYVILHLSKLTKSLVVAKRPRDASCHWLVGWSVGA